MLAKTLRLETLFFPRRVLYMEMLKALLMKEKNLILKAIMHLQNIKLKKLLKNFLRNININMLF